MTLPDILAAVADDGEVLRFPVPDSWSQGRTAYGGLTAALATAAVRRRFPDLPPLRSAQFAFAGPVEDEAAITATLLRRGRSAATVSADLTSPRGFGLRATFIFMAAVDSHVHLTGERSTLARPPEEAREFPFPPVFAKNFTYRTGQPPYAEPTADLACWVRLNERVGLDPLVELMAVGDALPPAALMLFKRFGPISSLNWTITLLTDAPATRDGWWLLRSTSSHAVDGVSSQRMAIWNTDGTPIVEASQAVGLFV